MIYLVFIVERLQDMRHSNCVSIMSVSKGAHTRAMQNAGVGRGLDRLIVNAEASESYGLLCGSDGPRLMGCGCPQGGVPSPLLWNLLVGGLFLEVGRSHAYADNIVLLFQGNDISELHTEASSYIETVGRWADDITLVFSAGKSKSIVLTWRRYISERSTLALGVLARISRTLGCSWGMSPELVIWAYNSLVLPVLEYGCAVRAGVLQQCHAVFQS